MKTQVLLVAVGIGLAALTNLNATVTIGRHPTNQVVSLNGTVSLGVTASSTAGPLRYQWCGQGVLLPDQTNRTLVLKSVQPAQAGDYYIVVNDTDSQPVQSNPATITVDPTFEKITTGSLVEDVETSETSTWWDYDNDDFLDVVAHLASGTTSGVLQSFYHNIRDGTFAKITTNTIAQTPKNSLIGTAGDIDNDGDQDLYVTSNYRSAGEQTDDLFRNDGGGKFSKLIGQPWTQQQDKSWDCSFVDFNRDGLLDILVVNDSQPLCLYQQTTGGIFLKTTAAQVGSIVSSQGRSLNAAWVDCDNDGDLDLSVQNYQGSHRLHRNDRGFFSVVTPAPFAQAPGGLGIWGDFDNDGFPELFVGGETEGGARPNALYRGLAGQDFANVAAGAGVAVTMSAWASAVGDYDNDGWLDIFSADWRGGQPNVLFHNRRDGTFESVDVGSPISDGDQRWGVRWVDYDNDGFLDLFMTCGTSPGDYARLNHLYRNNGHAIGNANHWLKLRLNGLASNRSGIGARIRVQATIAGKEVWQVREMTGNGYSQTCPGLVAHFGLGDATKADVVRIEWPSGTVQQLQNVTGDQSLTVWEPPYLRAALLPNDACQLTIKAEPNRAWRIEVSSDLKTWGPLATETHAEVTFQYTDTTAVGSGQRFYRIVGS